MKKDNIYIGTSGWHYKHWKGIFYPNGLKDADQLHFFIRTFSTVEINNSFYRLPAIHTFEKWYNQVPDHFIFAVKASRFITHQKKLDVSKDILDEFMQHANYLKDKLGPILFQLPPKWKINITRLHNFLKNLPKNHQFTFEFRDHSWHVPAIYELLKQYNCAFCIYDLAGYQSPLEVTADFVYVRLHGPGDKYEGSYRTEHLVRWANRCAAWQNEGKAIYVYFDNDQNAYATQNAQLLQDLLK
ncbi:DUF72 domain-containing protein [Sphingobacterium sp. N143]|uniref:DUF72 domain-containing protein n=1 Tax=Sphingobacterium sp. N143 TaxID=2746727 RepID=UPI002577B423|nr:DUF72 domain-containing protein [Sphingobacterium sp. N143]MDM1293086.1 DUF72 domain-containing protein [Sphingobacterium sp. N143]